MALASGFSGEQPWSAYGPKVAKGCPCVGPTLRPTATPIQLDGPFSSIADYVYGLLSASADGADPIVVAQMIKATAEAVKVIEFTELEERVRRLETRRDN